MADASETSTLLSAASSPSAGQTSPDPTNPNPASDQPPPTGEPAQPGSEPQQPNGDQPAEHPGDAEPAITEEDYKALSIGEGLLADETALGDYRKLAAEAKLPVATAQKILDLHGRLQAAAAASWQQTVQGWGKAAESDPFLSGGEVVSGGFASFKDARAAAGQFMSRYGDSELRQVLDQYGLGNHPALFRAIARAGRDLASDQLVTGSATAHRGDPYRAWYPTMGDEYFRA